MNCLPKNRPESHRLQKKKIKTLQIFRLKKKMKKVKFKGKYLQNNAYLERSPSPRENPKKKAKKTKR